MFTNVEVNAKYCFQHFWSFILVLQMINAITKESISTILSAVNSLSKNLTAEYNQYDNFSFLTL